MFHIRNALTEERLEILHTIKKEHPSSVYELAKMLGRDTKNVIQDFGYLKETGLFEMKRANKKMICPPQYPIREDYGGHPAQQDLQCQPL